MNSHGLKLGRIPRTLLAFLASLVTLAADGAVTGAAAPEGEPGGSGAFVAVLADLSGKVWIHGSEPGSRRIASLGERLAAGEIVQTEPDAAATIFMAGGQLLDVLGDSRVRISTDLAAGLQQDPRLTRLASSSLEIIERGVWVLSDPKGSEILPPMRGDGRQAPGPSSGSTPELLAPRRETVAGKSPSFYWKGRDSGVRIVIAHGSETHWSSDELSGQIRQYPADAPPLGDGEVYHWWIEDFSSGERLAPPASFRTLSRGEQAAVQGFETVLRGSTSTPDPPGMSEFLRCSYYAEMEAWTRTVKAALRILAGDPENHFARRSIGLSAGRMGLSPAGIREFLDLLQGPHHGDSG